MSNFVKTNINQSRGKGFADRGGHGHLWPPQALETWYAGHHFRSRREARWAVFFNTLGIKWEYEPQGFDINSTPYLPDFLLTPPDKHPYWFEVKGQRPTAEEQTKAAGLAAITETECFIYFEQPQLTFGETAIHFLPGCDQGLEAAWLWSHCACHSPQLVHTGQHWCSINNKPTSATGATSLRRAFDAARSARFGT